MTLRPPDWLVSTCLVFTFAGCQSAGDIPPSDEGSGGVSGDGDGDSGGGVSTGGTVPGGSGGEEAAGGSDASGGSTGDDCTFQITGQLSQDIPTVGVVDWSINLSGLTEARIEFSLDEPQEGELNVGSGGPISVDEPQALMLGLKPERSYAYRITASAGERVCVSPDQSLTTGSDSRFPVLTRDLGAAAASRAEGFVVTCAYFGAGSFIIDSDGDVVWWAESPSQCSRAMIDWDGEYMWMLKANPTYGDGGEARRVRMDGSEGLEIRGFERAHHDFAVLPGGATAFTLWANEEDLSSDLVERSADGAVNTVVRLDDASYLSSFNDYHVNALRYYASDDSYTISDLSGHGISKWNRQGQIQWLLREDCEDVPPSQCANAPVHGNHGHQLLEDGNILYFEANNGSMNGFGSPSPVHEYSFSEEGGTLIADLEWSYVEQPLSSVLGDVQRLPNGNTLVTYSTDGILYELSPSGELVQSLSWESGQFGYSNFRETLYGAPQ